MVLAWHHVVLRFGPLSPSLSTSHKSNLKKTALLRQILRGAAVIVGPRGSGEGPSPAVKAGPMGWAQVISNIYIQMSLPYLIVFLRSSFVKLICVKLDVVKLDFVKLDFAKLE